MKRILFCGGGSAGHVTPNLALMKELKYIYRVSYVGTGGIERTLVEQAGYPFYQVDCPKLVRSFTLKNLSIPFSLLRACKRAQAVLEHEKPDVVFSKGGFASFPPVWAARKLHIPVYTHESDLSPGLCTKLIAKKCNVVFTSFPETAALFPNGKHVGSPIRKDLFFGDKQRAMHKYSFSSEKPVLLVLGGGSGCRMLNENIRTNLNVLLKQWQILHLCGNGNLIDNPPNGYVQREFEGDMASAYTVSDCVLCRAGSNTIFETLALKKPALLVPLEHHSRGDQLQNALYFQKRGLCRVLREHEIATLESALLALYRDDTLRNSLDNYEVKNGSSVILATLKERASNDLRR